MPSNPKDPKEMDAVQIARRAEIPEATHGER